MKICKNHPSKQDIKFDFLIKLAHTSQKLNAKHIKIRNASILIEWTQQTQYNVPVLNRNIHEESSSRFYLSTIFIPERNSFFIFSREFRIHTQLKFRWNIPPAKHK